VPDIDAIYPLSPSQQGMLLETLAAARPGIHIEQSLFVLSGPLDIARFERAWQAVLDRHAVLRTAFVWRGRPEPLQVALRRVRVPLVVHDWRDLPAAAQDERFAAYLDGDRRAGFAPDRAPLVRLAVFRIADDTHRFVLTFHHMLLDGWSLSLILAEALAHHEGAVLPLPVPYQSYIRWQRAQDPAAAEAHWRAELAGFTAPTRWGVDDPDAEPAGDGYDQLAVSIAPDVAEGLRALAEAHRVSPGTLFQGVWGLLLAMYSGQRDVVFGTTVSGRPPELPGALAMVGLFINTVPMRVQLPRGPLWPWLAALQLRSAAARAFEHCAGGQIQRWCALPAAGPLYETVVVFENYPEDRSGLARASLRIDLDSSRTIGAQTSHPVTLLVGARGGYSLTLITRRDRIARRGAAAILAHYQALLTRIVDEAAHSIDDLIATVARAAFPRIRPAAVRAAAPQRPPRDAVELQLAAIWRDVLGCSQVGVCDSFFDLGGHSLLALDLVARIENQLGVSLPLSVLLDHPTIERIAAAIGSAGAGNGERGERGERVERVERDSASTPAVFLGSGAPPRAPLEAALFCVPGAAMDTISLQPLACALGDELPVWGLQPRGLDGRHEPLRTVEDTAALNVRALRAIQPAGPYRIAGHSYGAHVAYEMAQQLRAAGCEVALLAVLDARARSHGAPAPAVRDDEARLRRLLSLVARYLGRDLPVSTDALRALSPDQRIDHIAAALAEAGVLPVELGARRLGHYLRVGEATAAAFERYIAAGRYPVPTVVIRARTLGDGDDLGAGAAGNSDETLGWRALAGGHATVHWVDGDHVTMIARPHVDHLAEHLLRALRARRMAA
jgi:thioesterase domain-containing protein/acyl carrier protein